jgi:hypothetical protein
MPTTWQGYFGLHEIILYIVIVLLIGALGGGPALKALFNTILKFFGHGAAETIVNIEQPGGEMSGKLKECKACGLMVDPKLCPLHAAEALQSIANKDAVKAVAADLKESRDKLWVKLDGIEEKVNQVQLAVAKLVMERNFQVDERETGRKRKQE